MTQRTRSANLGGTIITSTGVVLASGLDVSNQSNAAYQQANTARDTANSAFNHANNAFDHANTIFDQANAAYLQANTARSDSNTTFATVNSTFGTVNTAITNAHNQANSAFAAANLRLSTSGGSISGDLSITGNLTVTGNATTINVSNLSVNDSMILLSTNAVGDSNDIGFIGHFDRGATATHAGLIRKATQNQFYLFDNYEVEPSNNVIDVTGNNFRVGNLRLGIINANSFVTSAGLNVTDQANSAFAAANNRVLKAGDTMTGSLVLGAGRTVGNGGIFLSHTGLNTDVLANGRTAGVSTGWGTFRIHQEAGNPGLIIAGDASQTAPYVRIQNNAESALVVVDSSGNLGIGTSSPSQKLDVTGSIRASSQLISTVATGTAPFAVSSTTAVTNLNADLLDGYQASSFVQRTNANDQATLWDPYGNYYTNVWGVGNDFNNFVNSGSYHVNNTATNRPADAFGYLRVWRHVGARYNLQEFTPSSDASTTYRRVGLDNGAGGYAWYGWAKYWSDGNDGSGSGLDADLLDGLQPSALTVGYCNNTTQGFNSNWNTDFSTTPAGSTVLRGDTPTGSSTGGPGGTWWFQQNMRHTNASNLWGVQVAWGWEDNANVLRTRNVTGGNFGAWVTYLNSANYTNYITGSSLKSQTFTGSGTFTVPAGVTTVWVTMSGGGGSGVGVNFSFGAAPGGGGGAYCVKRAVTVTPGSNISVVVGAGGAGVFGGSIGNDGSSSSFGSVSVSGGGGGGKVSNSTSYVNTVPGIGGNQGGSVANGVLLNGHGAGNRNGRFTNNSVGGGGAGLFGDGTDGSTNNFPVITNAAANSGAGAGGANGNSFDGSSGNGGSGMVIVEWLG